MRDGKLKNWLLCYYDKMVTAKINLVQWVQLRVKYRLKIMSSRRTLRYIRKNGCSVARFGDGELAFLMKEGYRIPFQTNSQGLAQGLEDTLKNDNPKLLLCIPRYLNSLCGCTKECQKGWWQWGQQDDRQKKVVTKLRETAGANYIFGDALITRPYMDRKNKAAAKKLFKELKKLWKGCNILIVEGEQTRLGVGNDLFSDTKRIRRILAPAVGAFDCYDQIISAVTKIAGDDLVLLALGPAATVLASDLASRGIRALDVGHIDIEYEWFLKGAKKKTAVQGKYTNEVTEGRKYTQCMDENYLSQVVFKVKKDDS